MNLKELVKIADAAKFSREEMIEDYDKINYSSTLAEKKEIAAKYGIESKKGAEIQHAILERMRDERNSRTSFDKEDVKQFYRLSDAPEQYKKLSQYLSQESRAFVEFLADTMYKNLEAKGLTKRFNVEVPITRQGYGMTFADMSMINRYANTKRFLKETTSEFQSAKAEHEDKIGAIRAKLESGMSQFKELYIKKAKDFAARFFKSIPESMEEYRAEREKYSKAEEERRAVLKEQGYTWSAVFNDYEIRSYTKKLEKVEKSIAKLRAILKNYTLESYVAEAEQDAIDTFEHNLTVLAEKVNAWDVNVEQMQVTRVAEDPKFFEMMVTDGTHKLYARSIWAAEWSEKVTPHFRFIVTDKKSR